MNIYKKQNAMSSKQRTEKSKGKYDCQPAIKSETKKNSKFAQVKIPTMINLELPIENQYVPNKQNNRKQPLINKGKKQTSTIETKTNQCFSNHKPPKSEQPALIISNQRIYTTITKKENNLNSKKQPMKQVPNSNMVITNEYQQLILSDQSNSKIYSANELSYEEILQLLNAILQKFQQQTQVNLEMMNAIFDQDQEAIRGSQVYEEVLINVAQAFIQNQSKQVIQYSRELEEKVVAFIMDGFESLLYFVQFAPNLEKLILKFNFSQWDYFLFTFIKRNSKKFYFFTEEKQLLFTSFVFKNIQQRLIVQENQNILQSLENEDFLQIFIKSNEFLLRFDSYRNFVVQQEEFFKKLQNNVINDNNEQSRQENSFIQEISIYLITSYLKYPQFVLSRELLNNSLQKKPYNQLIKQSVSLNIELMFSNKILKETKLLSQELLSELDQLQQQNISLYK